LFVVVGISSSKSGLFESFIVGHKFFKIPRHELEAVELQRAAPMFSVSTRCCFEAYPADFSPHQNFAFDQIKNKALRRESTVNIP